MNGLIFTPDRNSHGKKDYTGAFKPKAEAFAKKHKIPKENIIAIDVSKGMKHRKAQVLEALQAGTEWGAPHLDTVAFFCHGYATGIQLGFSWSPRKKESPKKVMNELAKAIYEQSDRTDICVPLYCCSTASSKDKKSVAGDGGFADELRDALCRQGAVDCRVFGHTTAGHTTNNPNARFFDGSGMPGGGTGGYWIARPNGPMWGRWKRYLLKGGWMEMPYMRVEEIRAKLVS